MLRGISPFISPDLMKVMMEMGQGDEIVFADANFPAASHADRLIRADGLGIPDLRKGVLPLFPLDQYVNSPVALMDVVPGDTAETPIWQEYRRILSGCEYADVEMEFLERFDFYERAKRAYAIVATGENARYANIILKKGVMADAN